MRIKTLGSLGAWSRDADDLRGAFVVIGREALWVPPGASTSAVAPALRYFIGGLPSDLLGKASAALRGENYQESPPGPSPPPARLHEAVRGNETAFIALSWREDLVPCVTGESQPDRLPAGRLSPVRVLDQKRLYLDNATLSFCASESVCPEPTFETPGSQPIRPTLRSLTADPSSERSAQRALGEAIERYAMGSVPHPRLRYSAGRDLPGEYLDPSVVVSYTTAQRQRLGMKAFSPADEAWWIEGAPIAHPERRIWIPAVLVFAPFPEVPAWTNIGIQSSNGAAYHPDPREAIKNGWLELVERDAFLRTWRQDAFPLFDIPPRSLPPIAGSVQRWIRARDGRNRVMTTLLPSPTRVPVCAMIASGPEIGIAIGAAAAATISEAASSAACECACNVAFRAPSVARARDVAQPIDHVGYYRFGDRFQAAERLARSSRPGPAPANRSSATLIPRGYTVELEVPPPFPGYAVKVIDPTLIPLTFGHDNEPLERHLCEVNSLAEVDPVTDLAAPHPFP
jgi:YcaO cyclodehydratase, ATP-ad Mg2+-binding